MRNLMLVMALVMFMVAPAAAQLTVAPSGGATIFIVDGADGGKEAKNVGDMFTKMEYQFAMDAYDEAYLGILGFYDGDAFGGFGVRYYRKVNEGIYPMFGVNLTILDTDRAFIDELTVAVGGEIGMEIWIPGPEDSSFPLTVSAGFRADVVGSDVTILPIEFAIPLGLF